MKRSIFSFPSQTIHMHRVNHSFNRWIRLVATLQSNAGALLISNIPLSLSRIFLQSGSSTRTSVLAELLVSYETVVDTQVVLLFALLLERIGDVVLAVPWLLPVTVPVGSPFLYVVIGNREEIHGVLDKFIVLLCSVSQKCPHVQ